MSLYQHLPANYQEKVLEKWTPVLEAEGLSKISSEQIRLSTALVLENTQREFDKVNESYTGQAAGMGAQAGAYSTGLPNGAGQLGSTFDYGANDARMPTIVIPTARRIFPELIAHNTVGVQPMYGPVGFAFAFRARYGSNGKGTVTQGTEIGYNLVDSAFTGASGNATTGAYWEAFAGTGSAGALGQNTYGEDGQGATLAGSEWWNIGEDMPMAKFSMEKAIVEAKSRKLAAHWSLELAEDMMNMHGVDVDAEMVNIISYEIQAEIDRQLLAEMVKAAIAGGRVSTWSPVSADGRNQLERIGTLYTQILQKSNEIAITSRRGPATFAFGSPNVCAILERLQDFVLDKAGNAALDTNTVGISKVGTMRNGGITLYRDTFAMGNYALLGYKGPTPYDAGIIYTPYIPVQLLRALGQENFTPRIGVRTRYGILSNLFGAGNYYHFIKVDGLTSSVLEASGSRVFMY